MTDQLPTLTQSQAVNTTEKPASSLLGRGLNAIQSRNVTIPREIDEAKLLEVMCRIMDAAFRLGHCTFKENAKFVLDTIREKFGDTSADAVTIGHLKGAYIATEQGETSDEDVVAFKSIKELLAPEQPNQKELKCSEFNTDSQHE